jgi:hypothetical protein
VTLQALNPSAAISSAGKIKRFMMASPGSWKSMTAGFVSVRIPDL